MQFHWMWNIVDSRASLKADIMWMGIGCDAAVRKLVREVRDGAAGT